MAILVFNGTNWDGCLGTQTIHASTNTSLTTTFSAALAFTAPNTTNAVTGAWFFLATVPTSGDVEIDLRESGATVKTGIALRADLKLGFNYIRFTTPHVFTTTAASAYAIRIRNTTASSGAVARDAGAGNVLCPATYDTASALGASDRAFVFGFHDSALTAKTLTFSGTSNVCGDYADTTMSGTTVRTVGAAITIGNGGNVVYDQSASTSFRAKGSIYIGAGGLFDMRASSTLSRIQTLEIDCATADGDHGILIPTGAAGGRFLSTGATVAVVTTFASGLGTAADPLVTQSAHGFTVGDEIVIGGATDYLKNERRYIISIPNPTEMVLSNTLGGSENALAQTHAVGAHIANLTRNSIIKPTTTTRGYWFQNSTSNTAEGMSSLSYTRLEYSNCQSGKGVNSNGSSSTTDGNDASIDGIVVYNNSAAGRSSISVNGKAVQSINDVVLYNTRGTNYGGQSGLQLVSGATRKTVDGVYHFADPSSTTNTAALSVNGAVGNTFTDVHSYGANAVGTASGYAIGLFTAAGNTFRNCSINGARVRGLVTDASQGNKFYDCDFGAMASNTIDIAVGASTLNTALFSGCSFASATLISGYLSALLGTEIRFHEMDGDTSKHRWYTNYGSAWSSGTGLTDTTVRTASSLALALKPEDATDGQSWETLIPAVPASQCGVFGYAYRNATFSAGTFKVELFLPGSTVADASYTFAATTGAWLPFNISAYYSGSTSRFARVVITAITATAGAYAFIDDLYDAGTGNKIAGLDVWHEGKPSPVIVAADVSAIPALVWGYSDATVNDGTMGKLLRATKLIGLK